MQNLGNQTEYSNHVGGGVAWDGDGFMYVAVTLDGKASDDTDLVIWRMQPDGPKEEFDRIRHKEFGKQAYASVAIQPWTGEVWAIGTRRFNGQQVPYSHKLAKRVRPLLQGAAPQGNPEIAASLYMDLKPENEKDGRMWERILNDRKAIQQIQRVLKQIGLLR